MARRDRVPRHKSSRRKRNKNPKLSPFQLEQKRAKLANQAPTAKTIGTDADIPHSQRGVFEFLQAKRARLEKRKQQQQEDSKRQATDTLAQSSEEALQEGKKIEGSGNNGGNDRTRGASQGLDRKKRTAGVERTRSQEGARADSPVLKKRRTDSIGASMSCDQKASTRNALSPDREIKTDSLGSSGTVQAGKQKLKKRSSNEGCGPAVSLNQEFLVSVGNPISTPRSRNPTPTDPHSDDQPRSVEEIIARKKEKKHRKKSEARRERVAREIQQMEAELARLVSKKGRKKSSRDDPGFNLVFDKKLKELQKEKNKAAEGSTDGSSPAPKKGDKKNRKKPALDAESDPHRGMDATGEPFDTAKRSNEKTPGDVNERKRISFDKNVEGLPPAAAASSASLSRPRRPKDFFELIDIPKFGERVEAPPVFDVVPNKDAAVTRLAQKLERNSTGLAEEKRLARLGLIPAITRRIDVSNAKNGAQSTGCPGAGEETKKKEMELLRERVMATYRQNRRSNIMQKKGVDMGYSFPKFSDQV